MSNSVAMSHEPGRSCPLRYRHGPAALAVAPEQAIPVLYVAGGVYGNAHALLALQDLVARETEPARLCFNGDFNWFDIDDAGFRRINQEVLAHDACQGNVEAELVADDAAAGCGCAYPEHVDAATVERSNLIHAALKRTARRHPDILAALAALPLLRRYRVGPLAIGVVHGDAESLAGWRFDVTALDDPANRSWLHDAFARAGVDVFASSHTCLPALRRYDRGERGDIPGVVINNGAAGMPNFRGRRCGVITRIALSPAPFAPLYGCILAGVHIDALALDYDSAAFERDFLANWPSGSAAHVSYYPRTVGGPDYMPARAAAPTR